MDIQREIQYIEFITVLEMTLVQIIKQYRMHNTFIAVMISCMSSVYDVCIPFDVRMMNINIYIMTIPVYCYLCLLLSDSNTS